jgi:hypothetical protein
VGHFKMPVSSELSVTVFVVTASTVISRLDEVRDFSERCLRSTMGGRFWVGNYCI